MYRPVYCVHKGCIECSSAYAVEAHDAICKFKPVPCDRCSELVPRGELHVHAAAACPEREATCVFSSVGCSAPLKQRGVSAHLDECTQAHMMLLLRVVMEQQDIIHSLS